MRTLAMIPVALLIFGCTGEPGPPRPPTAPAGGRAIGADAAKTALPPMPGGATFAFWEAMDEFMSQGRVFLPTDFENDTNDRGRTFLDYLPRDHPWYEGSERFACTIGSSRSTSYTITENLDPDDAYGNSLQLTVEVAGELEWSSLYTPPGWDSPYGTWGELNARFKQTVHHALRIVRTMHRFRAGTSEFWGYPVSAADVYRFYPDDRGRTFSDLYPGPLPFANAYTGLVTVPEWDVQAAYTGQMAVMGISDAWGLADGFTVTARGYLTNEFLRVSYRDAIVDPPWDDDSAVRAGDFRAGATVR